MIRPRLLRYSMQKTRHAHRASRFLNQAAASYAAQRYDDCIVQALRAREIDDSNPEAWHWLALGKLGRGDAAAARETAEAAMARFPDDARTCILAAEVLLDLGSYGQAKAIIEPVIERDPSQWAAWSNYSAILYSLQDYHAAKHAARKAFELRPADARVLSNYANALKETGDVPGAVAMLRQAVAQAPRSELVRLNLMFTMLFDESTTASGLLSEARQCAELMTPPGVGAGAAPQPDDNGRIRVGLLSNDLHAHACAYFIVPFVANIDHSRFELFVFSLNGHHDNITAKIRHHADHFVDVAGQSTQQVIDTVREARLDVLFDLGGYTRNTPLHYMVHRLAVRQVSWIGYPGSTGMPQIDYRVTDPVSDPEGHEAHYTEQLLRAPTVGVVYHPLVGRPLDAYAAAYRPRATPALANGHVTFGCCINLGKISARTLRLWSAVLARCPASKLLLECAGLDVDAVRLPLLARMAQAGIESERVICVPRRAGNQYLLYHDIDVVLDTSPLTAGANACDALWMGVPLVTLRGNACHERVASAFVSAVGLGGLACETEAQYVETAVALASNVGELNALRMSIRPMVEASPLFDAAGFCRWLEAEMAQWVDTYRQPGQLPQAAGEGLFFGGRWHRMEEITLLVIDALETGSIESLENVLENISAKWSKHWLVAYALSELLYRQGDREGALELLLESATLRKYSLPLYRLLLARLDECGQDKTALADFLHEAFGLELDYLEAQPVPSMREVAGIPTQSEKVAA
ncbi:tetratricopeptide repeat protein [Cupriavidus nantongensis]|nr:tetratricopeptide repeat protein [Cupriavidus nantongensis]